MFMCLFWLLTVAVGPLSPNFLEYHWALENYTINSPRISDVTEVKFMFLKRVLRKRRHCTGVKIPQTGKRGFRGQKTPISHRLRKGRFESKNPHFPCGAL